MKKILLSAFALSTMMTFAQQYGGMWIPTEVNEKEMKELGMKISAKDIFNPEKASIKDAVVQFDGGCTAEIISGKGLLLTNHHCGYDNIQSHSTVENDLLTNGFWAKDMNGELPNPGVTVDFITDIKEVTKDILAGTESLKGKDLDAKIKQNTDAYIASQKPESYQKISVRSMYYGNKFYAGECTRLEAVEAIYLAIQAANALESIRFPVSFACSFIYAELGKLPGLGTEIGFINRDESFHVAITNTLLKILPEDDPDFKVVMSDPAVIEKVRAIWRESLLEENEWIDYLFSEGDILGLTKTTLRKYLSYVATSRLESLNIGTIEDIIGEHPDLQSTKQNPINWINNWINNKANQPAPQETELNNYERNIIDMNVDLSEILIECGYENNNV